MKSLKGKTALIVEDDEVCMFKVCEFLKKSGIENIIQAHGGKEALTAFHKDLGHIDFIVMDCGLPDMNGVETTRHIRELERNKGVGSVTPIIALTGDQHNKIARDCFLAGMNHFIPKPVTTRNLEMIINQVEESGN